MRCIIIVRVVECYSNIKQHLLCVSLCKFTAICRPRIALFYNQHDKLTDNDTNFYVFWSSRRTRRRRHSSRPHRRLH